MPNLICTIKKTKRNEGIPKQKKEINKCKRTNAGIYRKARQSETEIKTKE